MTIQSMTGFGGSEAVHAGWHMKVECRSVNHRGLDVRVWAPREWGWIEPFVLEATRARFARGRLEVRVDVAPASDVGEALRVVDAQRFRAIAAQLQEVAAAAELAPPTVADVLAAQAAIGAPRLDLPTETAAFEAAITGALAALAAARAEEGARLRATMDELVDEIERCVATVSDHADSYGEEVRVRLEQRVREALARFDAAEIDERSIAQEIALYVERSNVAEELQRATSHIDKLRGLFGQAGTAPVGKQVDFYLQELFREANTTGSKSSSLVITNEVIAMKSAIEKMREQAANIE